MTSSLRLALPLAALLLALPACAQGGSRTETRGTWMHVNDHDGQRTELRTTGAVELNDEGDWVIAVAPGAYLSVAESGRGPDRRIDFRPGDGGGVRERYYVDGDARPLDAAGRAWARELISHAVRESGLGAEARVARIRARGGVGAVLEEVAELEGDVARRAWYHALLASGRMTDGDFIRVMEDATQRTESDVERRIVLIQALAHADGARRMAAVMNAASRLDSDVETRLVLVQAVDGYRLADAASRQAFLRAVESLESDVERRLVLQAVTDQGLAEGDARDAYFRVIDGLDSDVERRLVLIGLLDGAESESTVVSVLRSAAEMDSDVEKRLVLFQVPAASLRSARVTAAYREVVDAMESDTERGLALRRLIDRGR